MSQVLADVGRSRKPRTEGLTIVIDTGFGPNRIDDLAYVAADYCDSVKIAWASALVTKNLEDKILRYRKHSIEPLLGGTLFEYCFLWNRLDALEGLVREHRCMIEVSDGCAVISRREKLRWIETFARHGTVLSELGGKLESQALDWTRCVREELDAGARHVVIEGREIGPSGKEIRVDLVDRILAGADKNQLIFEALERYQQAWLINRLGVNVNLGNIRADDVVMVECYRQGLKEQTLLETHAKFGASHG